MADTERAKQPEAGSSPRPLLRRGDQAIVAALVLLAFVAMGVYWFIQGGPRGELIQIDRAEPLEAKYLVDINKADWPELAELPEVGETLARRIVDSRQADGVFKDHEDLRRVRGIGPLKLEAIKQYLMPMPDKEDVAGSAKPQAADAL